MIAIGTSLSISCIGFSDRFAPKAEKILVNIDRGDLSANNVKIEHPVLSDAKDFVVRLAGRFKAGSLQAQPALAGRLRAVEARLPGYAADEYLQKDCVDTYVFYEELSRQMGSTDIVLSGNSLDGCIIAYQAHRVKEGQRAFTSVCCGAMGWICRRSSAPAWRTATAAA